MSWIPTCEYNSDDDDSLQESTQGETPSMMESLSKWWKKWTGRSKTAPVIAKKPIFITEVDGFTVVALPKTPEAQLEDETMFSKSLARAVNNGTVFTQADADIINQRTEEADRALRAEQRMVLADINDKQQRIARVLAGEVLDPTKKAAREEARKKRSQERKDRAAARAAAGKRRAARLARK